MSDVVLLSKISENVLECKRFKTSHKAPYLSKIAFVHA